MHKLVQFLCLGVIVGSGLGRVQALHRDDLPTVVSLAHQLEQKAHHVHHYAEQNQHHFNWRERQMLRALHHCDQDARTFHQTVEDFFAHPDEVMHTWDHFLHSAHTANAIIRTSHTMRHVLHDWNHVVQLANRIHHLMERDDHGGHPIANVSRNADELPAPSARVSNFEKLYPAQVD